MVRSKPSSCSSCSICSHGTDFSHPEGLGTFGIAIIAEASGEAEARDGLPLRPYAASGGVLERTLRRLGYSREQFAITNILRCRPRENFLDGAAYEADAIAHCQANLLAFLRQYQPKVIIALGNIAFRTLTGVSGTKRTVSHMRGYVFRALPEFCAAAGTSDLLVIPTYHPAFLRRGAIHLSGVFARDIQRAVNIRKGVDSSFILDMPQIGSPDTVAPWEKGYVEPDSPSSMAEIEAWLAKYNLRYTLHPTRVQLDSFCRDVKARSDAWLALPAETRSRMPLALSHDIETYESATLDEDESDGFSDTRIRLSQFSIEPGQGIALSWAPEHIQATRWLLKLALPKVGHNYWLFDWRVLKAVSLRDFGDRNYLSPAGDVFDTLQQFHYFQPDLPAHLQYAASYAQFPFPWKHLAGENLEVYGCCDTDSTLRIHQISMRTMIDRGIWFDNEDPARAAAGYLGMVQAVRPILAAMEDRGLPINNERRMALGVQFDQVHTEVFAELDARFPNAARKLTPKEKGVVKGYSGVPPQVKQLLEDIRPTVLPQFTEVEDGVNSRTGLPRMIVLDAAGAKVTKKFRDETLRGLLAARWTDIPADDLARIYATEFQEPATKNDDDEDVEGEFYRYEQREVGGLLLDGGLRTPGRLAWVRVYKFSPNSSDQLMNYMRVKKHEIPFNKKEKRETTGKKDLERLAAKHHDDFYLKVIECREMSKMSSVYIDGFKPAADGRVHTTFTFATATGQLSSRAPNTQNYPAHGKLGKAVKSMIEAPDGYELANWDFKSYHVLMLGFLAEDPTYMRMARLDMHSFVTWHFLKLPGASTLHTLPDAELMEKFAWLKANERYKAIRDRQSKPSILGIGLGLMPPHLYDMNREHFESLGQVKQFRSVIEGLFPKVFRWQNAVCQEAHQNQVLYNRFRMLRMFYEVMAPDGRGGWKPGDQFNAAMALRVQSEAHGDLRERLKAMRRAGADEKYGLFNTIHDSFQFCYPIGLRTEMYQEIGGIIGRPSNVLKHPVLAPEGLEIGVECAIGKNMAELQEYAGVAG